MNALVIAALVVLPLLTIANIEIARRLKPGINPSWLALLVALPVPAAVVVLWAIGMVQLGSAACTDAAACGPDAMMALTIYAGIGLFGSFLICLTTALLWTGRRR